MPEIVFKGKEYVYNHHLTVPYRPLVTDAAKGIGSPALDGNLVIHGDNLQALKSLLPRHAGGVDLIFIDPPYNTGRQRHHRPRGAQGQCQGRRPAPLHPDRG